MKRLKTVVLGITLSWLAQFAGALEERHTGQHTIHSENVETTSRRELPAEMSGKAGPGQAVEAADPVLGFKLSDLAARTIGLSFVPVRQSGSVLLPREAIVHSKDEIGVYRFRDGWLKLIPGRITNDGDRRQFTSLKSGDLRSEDQVAVSAVPIVRVTDIYVFSAQEGEGE